MLRYKTFDQLMAGVESDLKNYADEGMFDRRQFIKVVRRVNADLGLKVYSENSDILYVRDFKATLPFDFMYLQLALGLFITHSISPEIQGVQTEAHSSKQEDIPVKMIPTVGKCNLTECNSLIWVTQKVGERVNTFKHIEKLSLTKSSRNFCVDTCLNFRFNSPNQMQIEPDGETVHFSFREGKVYINYLCDMIDDENNVLILDHPLVNDYYEYAIKKRFFENMELNKEGDFLRDYQMMDLAMARAKREAIGFVNTPEYGEIIKSYEFNRRRFYNQYIRYFDEHTQGIFKY